VLWQTGVGLTSYRSGLVVLHDQVLVPSQGAAWDGEAEDTEDGLWLLDKRTGVVEDQFVPPGDGERDVNGVSVTSSSLIVPTDQGMVHAFAPDGSILWSADVGGDVEGAPALSDVNGDGVPDIGAAVEKGSFRVLDGLTGAELYAVDVGKDNPFAQAAAADVTGDGIAEWFVATRRKARLRAIDGETGEVLWTLTDGQGEGGAKSPPLVFDADGDGELEVAALTRTTLMVASAATGEVGLLFRRDYGGTMLGLGYYPDGQCILVGNSHARAGLMCVGLDGGVVFDVPLLAGRISASPVVGDVDGRPGDEVVIATEAGTVEAFDSAGHLVWRWHAGSAIECSATLADLTGDGRNEVLVASHDGMITALRTRGSAADTPSYWRVDPQQTGAVHEP